MHGYLFLQDIYYSLGSDKICKDISKKYRIKYYLNSVLSNLIYTRIIEPSSKLSAFEAFKKFLEQPNFELQNIYRALEITAAETDSIESAVYKNSLNVVDRNTGILFYDCTNYFFEIEESFRILKTDFKARPVYLKRDDRIKAHFTTCFLALLIYRILEHKLDEEYTSSDIIKTLRNMNFKNLDVFGYIPTYTRNDLTDKLHEKFKFNTDTEIVPTNMMKKIIKRTKNKS